MSDPDKRKAAIERLKAQRGEAQPPIDRSSPITDAEIATARQAFAVEASTREPDFFGEHRRVLPPSEFVAQPTRSPLSQAEIDRLLGVDQTRGFGQQFLHNLKDPFVAGTHAFETFAETLGSLDPTGHVPTALGNVLKKPFEVIFDPYGIEQVGSPEYYQNLRKNREQSERTRNALGQILEIGPTAFGERAREASRERPTEAQIATQVLFDPVTIAAPFLKAGAAAKPFIQKTGLLKGLEVIELGKQSTYAFMAKRFANGRFDRWASPALNRVDEMFWKGAQVTPTPIKERVAAAKLWVERTFTDRFAMANKVATSAKKHWRSRFGTEMPEWMDSELKFAMVGGRASAGLERAQKATREAVQTLGDIPMLDLDDYLFLRHQMDVIAMHPERKVPAGFSSEKELADAIIDMETEMGFDRFNQMHKAAKVYTDAYADLLRRKVVSGLVDYDTAKMLREKYPFYNPTRYIEGQLAGVVDMRNSPFSVTSNGLRRMSEIGSEHALEPASAVLSRGLVEGEVLIARNDAAKSVAAAMRNSPEFAPQIRKVHKAVPAAFEDEKIIWRPRKGEIRGTISYMHHGKREVWEVPMEVERAAKSMAELSFHGLERVLQAVNAVPRAFLVSYNPAFMAANLMFDTITVAVTRGVLPHKTAAAVYKNIAALFREDKILHEMLKAGGDVGGFHGDTPEQILRTVRKQGGLAVHKQHHWDKLLNPVKSLVRTLRSVGHQIELSPRRAVFEKALSEGASYENAALQSRRATVDFQRAGWAVRHANSAYLFLNPAVQGTILPWRALRDYKSARYGLAGYMALHLGAYAWNRQFPEYQDISLFDKYGKLVFMLPSNEFNSRGDKVPHTFTVIPTLREFAAFSAPMVYLLGKLDNTAPESTSEFLDILGPMMNPFSQITDGGFTPTYIGETFNELQTNYDSFRDRPIVPIEMQGAENEAEQFNEFTSLTARRVGGWLGISPMKVDFLLRSGALYDVILATDMAIRVSEDGIDPHIDAIVAQLEELQEIFPPDEIAKRRRQVLSDLSPEDREAVRVAELAPQPRLPFVSSIINRFYRKGSGNLYDQGNMAAERELKFSAEQTRAAAVKIAQVAKDLNESRWVLEQNIAERPDGYVDWLNDRRLRGAMWEGVLKGIHAFLPNAAQLQEDPELWARWQEIVFTLGGAMEDSRSHGQVLAAGWRAIPVTDITPGVPDYLTWFKLRDEYRANLTEEERGILDDELRSSMSPVEREMEDDFKYLRTYWETTDNFMQAAGYGELWEKYLRSPKAGKVQWLAHAPADFRAVYQASLADKKAHRENNARLRNLLIKWGYLS